MSVVADEFVQFFVNLLAIREKLNSTPVPERQTYMVKSDDKSNPYIGFLKLLRKSLQNDANKYFIFLVQSKSRIQLTLILVGGGCFHALWLSARTIVGQHRPKKFCCP